MNAADAAAGGSPWARDTSDATFEADALERSHDLPVVVDFWAPWCAPCQALKPMLESLAAECDGQFLLVKANVDQMPRTAAAFRVDSIPAVFALRHGRVADSFQGVLTEPQLRAWLMRLLPTEAERALAQAAADEARDPAVAEAGYRRALELDPQLADAQIGLARLRFAAGDTAASQQLLDELAARGYLEPEAERLQTQLKMARKSEEVGDVAAAQAAVDAAPNDRELQFSLAEAQAAAGEHEAALATALRLLQEDRAQFRDRCRELMVSIFQLLPDDSPLTADYRRKLSMALY